MIAHVVGARPNFPKAAPVFAALAARGVKQALIHTGQHYDDRMSAVFFDELGLPAPDVDLGVGSGSHAGQTAAAMVALEHLFAGRPELTRVVVYGDVNSTLAAALVAAKRGLPVAHVEAGLRSFEPGLPEEINRRLTDQLSDRLFTTSPEANTHLGNEGIAAGAIHFVGNPMIDTLLAHLGSFDPQRGRAVAGHGDLRDGDYLVVTLHRPANVDDPHSARALVSMLAALSSRIPMVLPLHPRGRTTLEAAGLTATAGLRICEPLPYSVFLGLVRGSAGVVTDSGGVQEETTVLGVPCLTVRPSTERPVTLTHGTNRLVPVLADLPAAVDETLAATAEVLAATDEVLAGAPGPVPLARRPPLWDGAAGPRIADVLEDWLD